MLRRAGFDPDSHSGKALVNVLETYPRDELFQIDEDTLYDFALAILQLDERPRVRVLARRDRFDRFVSVLVYVPRDRYDTHVRARDRRSYLAERLSRAASAAFYPFFPEGPLVRVHFIIGRDGGETPDPDRADARAGGRRASCAPGATGSPRRCRWRTSRREPRALLGALPRRLLRRPIARPIAPPTRSPTSA